MINNPQFVHDRLDLKQHSEEFSDPRCGTVNKLTKKPDFCSFDCPLLKEIILSGKSPSDPIVPVPVAPVAPVAQEVNE